ncbi:MalY/PatB family protein [Uliginosibacterium aquaticum]|uniref:cysteine-S-conjugate beta-lyase n=1 Tax=Uliginosibacterium aquaticum TaxID=2731212 RepID=A0ABX2IQT5_9RHOO|nr:PatB family C-S lyase [Uliginosibacterium aquaticum]NSL56490.1 putative C-S lyase [Uliginosibacterium aquaticum]
MAFDFDTPPDRRHSDSIKWQRYAHRDVLPMWVADMDFAAPPAVREALQARLDHGVFGYAHVSTALREAIVEGIARDHDWQIEPDWLVFLPGVVQGFNLACRLAGEPGDGVLTFPPIYPPMLLAPDNHQRRLVRSELVLKGGRWEYDWDGLDALLATQSARLLMLCNPHNPVGRVWTREELTRLAWHAEKHDWLICSDDIHCGLVIDSAQPYLPIAALDEAIAQRSITLMAPSKTWNIPALGCAFAVIPNAHLRKQYLASARGLIPDVNVLGLVACEAAYRDGGPWREALLAYLQSNARALLAGVNALPGLSMTQVEATYLAWLDCRGLGLTDPQRHFERHGLGLSDGRDFGLNGFLRLNFGCSRALLDEALQRLATAVRAV